MLNKVTLIGNLGRDAELRYTPGGQAVATLNLATTEKWKDKDGGLQEKTEWHRCVLWGKRAEALQSYLVKGKQVYLEGRLETKKWTDKNGQEKYTTEVNVLDVKLLGGGRAVGTTGAGRSNGAGRDEDYGGGAPGGHDQPVAPIMDDDIPF